MCVFNSTEKRYYSSFSLLHFVLRISHWFCNLFSLLPPFLPPFPIPLLYFSSFTLSSRESSDESRKGSKGNCWRRANTALHCMQLIYSSQALFIRKRRQRERERTLLEDEALLLFIEKAQKENAEKIALVVYAFFFLFIGRRLWATFLLPFVSDFSGGAGFSLVHTFNTLYFPVSPPPPAPPPLLADGNFTV